jgi:DNA-directed RNA polymerase
MRGAKRTLQVAAEMVDRERIYFPHMLDFRGRIYPIPSGLQPQGNDLARGLLEFADGVAITEENGGAGWLAIAVATAFGVDKVSYDERIDWVYQREADWRLIASDPLEHKALWVGDDKPVQALAAVLEWVAFLEHGEGFVSHLPVMVDGTCNGLQHLSAMTRDAEAGREVNLVRGERPADIYQTVADRLKVTIERIAAARGEQGIIADRLLDMLGRADRWDRKLTKRQVMVLPYGGTKDAFFKYTRQYLDEKHPIDHTDEGARAARTEELVQLTLHLWDEVNRTVPGGMAVMKWLQACAKAVMQGNQPIYWVTPCGFVVRHFYGETTSKLVHVMLDGDSRRLRYSEISDRLDTRAQLKGIAPNFVHSLDASALVTTISKAADAGITSFISVHDAYGTHAGNMWALFRMLREGFVETHRVDNLMHFRGACARVLADLMIAEGKDPLEAIQLAEEKLPPPLPLGTLDLEEVLGSDYFFA